MISDFAQGVLVGVMIMIIVTMIVLSLNAWRPNKD